VAHLMRIILVLKMDAGNKYWWFLLYILFSFVWWNLGLSVLCYNTSLLSTDKYCVDRPINDVSLHLLLFC